MIGRLKKYLYYKNHVILLSKFRNKKIKKDVLNRKGKIYYIIKRDRWRGMFSNLHYVILNIIYAENKNYTPIVDMQNYPTIYNEFGKLNKSYNSWNYYFNNLTKIELEKIYKNKNYILSNEKNIDTTKINPKLYNKFKKILKSFKIQKKILKFIKNYEKQFTNKKILGVHFRGSDQKTAALHPFPPDLKQIIQTTKKINDKIKFDYIFLVTEEKKYLKKFLDVFGKKLIYLNCFRSDKDIFEGYPRKNHRYLLGFETIVNMILLSKVNYMIHSNSNLSAMARHYSKKKFKEAIIFNGINSGNIFICNFLWYLKKILPYNMGGFKNKIIYK